MFGPQYSQSATHVLDIRNSPTLNMSTQSEVDVIALSKLIADRAEHISGLEASYKRKIDAEKSVLKAYLLTLRGAASSQYVSRKRPIEESADDQPTYKKARKEKECGENGGKARGARSTSPVEEEKSAPRMLLSLHGHQQRALDFAQKAGRCILALDVGAGKTAIAIAAIVAERQKDASRRVLIVVPASLIKQWLSEIAKFSTLRAGLDFVISSYASLKKIAGQYDVVVGDEAHMIKKPTTKRSKNFKGKCASAGVVLMLTGTPAESHDELFHLLHVAAPRAFPSREQYRSRFCQAKKFRIRKRMITSYKANRNRVELAEKCANVMLAMEIHEVAGSLPKLHLSTVNLEDVPPSVEEGDWMSTWRECCNLKRAAAIKYIQRYVVENVGEKESLCVFVFHKAAANAIQSALGGPRSCSLFTGDSNRSQALVDFQSGTTRLAVLTMPSSGVGLNLQFANHLIFAEISPDSIMMKQTAGRIYRLGQTRECYITKLCGGSKDEEILSKLSAKEACSSEILDACKGPLVEYK
jgi:superfamily II DNA or RNA helicase